MGGCVDYAGRSVLNYHNENLPGVSELYLESDHVNLFVIVDITYDNAGGKYPEQIRIAISVQWVNDGVWRQRGILSVAGFFVTGS